MYIYMHTCTVQKYVDCMAKYRPHKVLHVVN